MIWMKNPPNNFIPSSLNILETITGLFSNLSMGEEASYSFINLNIKFFIHYQTKFELGIKSHSFAILKICKLHAVDGFTMYHAYIYNFKK